MSFLLKLLLLLEMSLGIAILAETHPFVAAYTCGALDAFVVVWIIIKTVMWYGHRKGGSPL